MDACVPKQLLAVMFGELLQPFMIVGHFAGFGNGQPVLSRGSFGQGWGGLDGVGERYGFLGGTASPHVSYFQVQNIRNKDSVLTISKVHIKQSKFNFSLYSEFGTKIPNKGGCQIQSRLLSIQNLMGVTIGKSPTHFIIPNQYINKIMSQAKNRKLNLQRVVDSVSLDKGKRHFWNREKKDYGFYQSEEPYLPINYYANQNSQQPHHRRRHSTIGTHNYDAYQLNHESLRNSASQNSMDSYRKIGEEQKQKKQLNLVSHNIEVKLPAIGKNTNRVSTQDSEHLASASKPYEASPSKNIEVRPNQRVRTQSYAHSERTKKIRYSPTYVCSFNNPLPTFKLYDTGSRRPLYQYGFSEERG